MAVSSKSWRGLRAGTGSWRITPAPPVTIPVTCCRWSVKKPERLAAGSAGNVGQKILTRANAKIALLQGLNGLRGGATA